MKQHQQSLSFEESEANRRDPQWGDPVNDLAVHAWHWIESADARHPEQRQQLDALASRLEIALGDLWSPDDTNGIIFRGTSTDGEIVLALKEIVEIMIEVAPLLADPGASH